ncbi:MAG: hypothetical protein U9O56_05150 [Campylobacterota bacterium]|nr:hypothetical protein [Campylobacterota bacterium]
MKWEKDPLSNSTTKDEDSVAGGFIGLQGGIEYFLVNYPKYSIISQAIYQEYFHSTQVTQNDEQTNIKHDRRFGIGVGVRYNF